MLISMKFPFFFRAPSGVLTLLALALLGTVSTGQATVIVVDGGFETPSLAANGQNWTSSSTAATGWSTTEPDHKIEVWTSGFYGVSAYEGNQFAEINANEQATLFQDVSGLLKGLQIDFSFAHRGRVTNESMRFSITDLGADGLYGTADDTTLFSQVYTDGTSAWGTYTSGSTAQILTTGDTLRFSFESLTPGSYGNFLDGVEISTATATAPEPGTWAMIALLFCATYGSAVASKLRRTASQPR
jgi:hypothetical protein